MAITAARGDQEMRGPIRCGLLSTVYSALHVSLAVIGVFAGFRSEADEGFQTPSYKQIGACS